MAEVPVNIIRDEYREEALQKYGGMSEAALNNELRRLERGPGIFGWIKDRIKGLFNMAKMIVMSVALGRSATAQRLEKGSEEARRQAAMNSLRKEEQIKVLHEMLGIREEQQEQGMDGQAKEENGERSDEWFAPEQEAGIKGQGQEQTAIDAEQQVWDTPQDQEQAATAEEKETEGVSEQENTVSEEAAQGDAGIQEMDAAVREENPAAEETAEKAGQEVQRSASGKSYVFSSVVKDAASMDGYAEELKEFMEGRTGISRDLIEIRNPVIGEGPETALEILFKAPLKNVEAPENGFPLSVRIDREGNCIPSEPGKEVGKMEKNVAYAVLAFTSKDYIYKDNRHETLIPGTTPSRGMVKKFLEECYEQVRNDPDQYVERTKQMFGRDVTFVQEEGQRVVYINDPERKHPVDLSARRNSSEAVIEAMKPVMKVNNILLRSVSNELFEKAAQTFDGVGYSKVNLKDDINRETARFLASERKSSTLDYLGHEVAISRDRKQGSINFSLDGRLMFRMDQEQKRPNYEAISERMVSGVVLADGSKVPGLYDALEKEGLTREDVAVRDVVPEQREPEQNTAEQEHGHQAAEFAEVEQENEQQAQDAREEQPAAYEQKEPEQAEPEQEYMPQAQEYAEPEVETQIEDHAEPEPASGLTDPAAFEPEQAYEQQPEMGYSEPDQYENDYDEEYETVYEDSIPVGSAMDEIIGNSGWYDPDLFRMPEEEAIMDADYSRDKEEVEK